MTINDFLSERYVLFLVIRYALKCFFRVLLNKHFLDKQMSVVVRKIMKYHRYKLRYSVVTVTHRMCCFSKSVCQVAVVSDFLLLFVTVNKSVFTTDMTFSSFIVIAFIFFRKIISAGSLYFLMHHISRSSSSFF